MTNLSPPDAPTWRKYLVLMVVLLSVGLVFADPIVAYEGCRLCKVVHAHPVLTVIYFFSLPVITIALFWSTGTFTKNAYKWTASDAILLICLSAFMAFLLTLGMFGLLASWTSANSVLVSIALGGIGFVATAGTLVLFMVMVRTLRKSYSDVVASERYPP